MLFKAWIPIVFDGVLLWLTAYAVAQRKTPAEQAAEDDLQMRILSARKKKK